MRKQHGRIPFFHFKGNKQKHKADRGYDLRVHKGQVIDLIHDFTDDLFGFAQTDRCDRSHNRGNDRCQDRNAECRIQCFHHISGFQHVLIPAKRKTCKYGQRFSFIKRENDHIKNRKVEKDDQQCHQNLSECSVAFFQGINPPFRRYCEFPLHVPPSSKASCRSP